MLTCHYSCAVYGHFAACQLALGWAARINHFLHTFLLADGLDYAFTDADEASEFLAVFEAFAATAEGRGAARVRHLRGLVPIDP